MNLLLLCHGATMEATSFALGSGQQIQYRGNYGANLTEDAARTLVRALLSDPYMTDTQLTSSIPNYEPQLPLEGPMNVAPDFRLWGDPRCFCMDMSTREWV